MNFLQKNTEIDKLHIGKLETIAVNLSKLSNLV